MKESVGVALYPGGQEENLPDYYESFPYIASKALLSNYPSGASPWHWHKAVELFYMAGGSLEYLTPNNTLRFDEGMCGMVNSGVLHMTRTLKPGTETVQYLHIFDVGLIAGDESSLIYTRYVQPLIADKAFEVAAISPKSTREIKLIERLKESFKIDDGGYGYEMRLCGELAGMWPELVELIYPSVSGGGPGVVSNERLKAMLDYIRLRYAERISVADIAAAAYLSERECYRTFSQGLHMSPVEYINDYRLRAACALLEGDEDVTAIALNCGFGSASYFGRVFQRKYGCTPTQYRRAWRERNSKSGN